MGAKVTVGNARVYTHIKDEILPVSGTTFPGASATMTNFRALANMTNAAFLVINVQNSATSAADYAIPLLLTT